MVTLGNRFFIINADDKYEPLLSSILKRITQETNSLREFFDVKRNRKIIVTIYDDKLKIMSEAADKGKYFEEYAQGSFLGNEIDVLCDFELSEDNLYKLVNRVVHQYSHVLYANIYKGKFDRPLWLDEGLAQNLSQERVLLEDDLVRCKSVFLSKIVNKHKEIPSIEFLKKEGESYKTIGCPRYNGYLMSYFMVNYLLNAKAYAPDTGLDYDYDEKFMSKYNAEEISEFRDKGARPLLPRYDVKSIIRDEEKIKELEKYIVSRTINFFGSSFGLNMAAASYKAIKTPEDLIDFMDASFSYGWLDKNRGKHYSISASVLSKYQVGTFDEALEYGLVTPIEKTKFAAKTLRDLGLNVSIFSTLERKGEYFCIHPFVVYLEDDKYYYFEQSLENNKGIFAFDSLDDLAEYFRQTLEQGCELYEMYDIPDGLSYEELIGYISKQDKIIGTNNDFQYTVKK